MDGRETNYGLSSSGEETRGLTLDLKVEGEEFAGAAAVRERAGGVGLEGKAKIKIMFPFFFFSN